MLFRFYVDNNDFRIFGLGADISAIEHPDGESDIFEFCIQIAVWSLVFQWRKNETVSN